MFLERVAKSDFVIGNAVPVDFLIGFTNLELLQANLYLVGQFFDLHIDKKSIKNFLKPERDNL